MRIGCVGAGRMGRGIAVAFATVGYDVVLVDAKHRAADDLATLRLDVLASIRSETDFLADLGLLTRASAEASLGRVAFLGRNEAEVELCRCDVIFEAVPETLEAKRQCFAFIGEFARPDCIIASTSSTIDPEMLAPLISGAERFLNAHWLNPAYLMPLVELAAHERTEALVIGRLKQLLVDAGKVPISCKGSAGYIVPRIQTLAMNEAARIVEEGVATAEDVDMAIRVGFGPRFAVLGLLEFSDWGGGEILYFASKFLADRIDPARFAPPDILTENMQKQQRGLCDGRGFHDYASLDVGQYRRQRLTDFVDLLRHRDLLPPFKTDDAIDAKSE